LETRARYILVGLFTIAGLLGIMAFLLWFARIELDRQFAYYDIRFSSVSGLSNASDVRFSGLPVGRVVDVRLSPTRDGTILVRVEVDADTPVRTDSVATIEAQGVTGVSFVSIGPGTPEAPLLTPTASEPFPVIEAGRSTLQTLSEDAPELLSETLRIVKEVGDLIGEENAGRLDRILTNIETASDDFAQTLDDFSKVANTVGDFAEQISRFNSTLDSLTGEMTGVLASADKTLASIGELSEQGKTVLSTGNETLNKAQDTMSKTERFISDDLTVMTRELRQTISDLRTQVTAMSEDARAMMKTLGTTGSTATARLNEARSTLEAVDALIARLDETAVSVGGTATRMDDLIESDGAPLLSETRAMVAQANRAIQSVSEIANTDLPAIFAEIRTATETSSRTITRVGENLTSASAGIDETLASARGALDQATLTFGKANETLAAINGAIETGNRALSAADRAFTGADRVINEDMSQITASLQATIDSLDAAIAQVSGDLPKISEDLRSASQSASETLAELRGMARESAPAVRDFTTTALPLYTRLAQETRTLIANLDRLTRQIERDPTRFFLDRENPEFRR